MYYGIPAVKKHGGGGTPLHVVYYSTLSRQLKWDLIDVTLSAHLAIIFFESAREKEEERKGESREDLVIREMRSNERALHLYL